MSLIKRRWIWIDLILTNFSFDEHFLLDFYTYVCNWTKSITTFILVDRFPSVRPPSECSNQYSSNNNICSTKQTSDETDRTKYQRTNRSTSLPSRQSFSSTKNIEENLKQRRRYASDSNKNNNNKTTALVTSFIQYLRSELRATTNGQKYDHSRIQKEVKVKK